MRYSTAAELVNLDEASTEYGMFVRFEVPPEEGCFEPQNKLWWDGELDKPISTHTEGADPYLLGVGQGLFLALYTGQLYSVT